VRACACARAPSQIAERAVSAEAAAPLRAKLPYGQEYVDSLQAMLLEKTFRAAVYDQGGDASGCVRRARRGVRRARRGGRRARRGAWHRRGRAA
jgi:hypothetical protein